MPIDKTKRIYIALGSNLGEKKKFLTQAISLLKENIVILKQAPMYESHPVGYREQDSFYNTVLSGDTRLKPMELLIFLHEIEEKLGRVKRFKNGPREIDIDILLYEQQVIHMQELIIPHPSMHLRDFVLRPLVDIAPNVKHPVLNKSMEELYRQLPQKNLSIFNEVPQ